MGSAVLSTELAFDFITEEQAARCQISNAPLVEGAIAATMEASSGQDLSAVNQAAEAAAHFIKVSP